MGAFWTFLLSSILSLLFLPLCGRRPDIYRTTVSKDRLNENSQPTNLFYHCICLQADLIFSAYLLSVAVYQSLSHCTLVFAIGLCAFFCGHDSHFLSHRFFVISVQDRRLGLISCLKGYWMFCADRVVDSGYSVDAGVNSTIS